jgi:peptidoglycan/LPS O-acetylase OafA/YrhL
MILFAIIKNTKKISFAIVGMITWILALQLLNPWIISTFMTSDKLKGWQYGLTGGAKQWLPYWNVGSFFAQFLCGSLAALVIVALRARGALKSRAFDLSFAVFAIAAIWLVAIRLVPGASDSFTQQPYVAPFYAILMAGALVSASMSTQIYKLLDNKLFSWIAKLSFSIYLWHFFIIEIIQRKFLGKYVYYGLTDSLQWVIVSSIVLCASILIAATSWRFLESPVLKYARTLGRRQL